MSMAAQITAQSYMSSPVRTVLETATLEAAQQILLQYGHTGLCVVNNENQLVGMLSRRDIEVAVRHGLGQRLVLSCMCTPVRAIAPETSLAQVQSLLLTYGIGRLPVVAAGALVGIVTRSDVLRQCRQLQSEPGPFSEMMSSPAAADLFQHLEARSGLIWPVIQLIAQVAEENSWGLYLVGGGVRDLLLSYQGYSHPLTDIDLVVDGAASGAGVRLAEAVQSRYPNIDLKV